MSRMCIIFLALHGYFAPLVSIDYNGMSEDAEMKPNHGMNFDLSTDPARPHAECKACLAR